MSNAKNNFRVKFFFFQTPPRNFLYFWRNFEFNFCTIGNYSPLGPCEGSIGPVSGPVLKYFFWSPRKLFKKYTKRTAFESSCQLFKEYGINNFKGPCEIIFQFHKQKTILRVGVTDTSKISNKGINLFQKNINVSLKETL